METTEENKNKGRRIRAYVALSLVVVALVIFGWQWYKSYTTFITTDDAYVDADKVAVSPKVLGRIAAIYAAEGDSVTKGELLVELDSTDLVAQKQQSVAARNQASAASSQAVAKYNFDLASIKVQEVALEKAKEDLDRAKLQFDNKVLTKEQYDHAKKTYESSQAQLDAAKAQVNVSKSMIESAESTIRTAGAQVNTVQTQLRNTRIYAPSSGRIAKRWQLPGDVAQPGQPVFTITKDSALYITSFFEETKIAYLHIGKKVEFAVDAFPGVTFTGEVSYIASNTASQFSLIPPNNASGNFTKVTQRIPIRISILDWDKKDKYPHLKLVAGMSAFLKIRKD
ncbi:MAG: HlyD family secretion protein [Bacteroidetes bacterium]|nr:HlyD family secretion protein [Bacteroidota bacterium]